MPRFVHKAAAWGTDTPTHQSAGRACSVWAIGADGNLYELIFMDENNKPIASSDSHAAATLEGRPPNSRWHHHGAPAGARLAPLPGVALKVRFAVVHPSLLSRYLIQNNSKCRTIYFHLHFTTVCYRTPTFCTVSVAVIADKESKIPHRLIIRQ